MTDGTGPRGEDHGPEAGPRADPEIPGDVPAPRHVTGALMLSWGPVHVGRELLAVDVYDEVFKYLGRLHGEGRIDRFRPYFFADGNLSGTTGFFIIEGDRSTLDDLRRSAEFVRLLIKANAVASNVRISTLTAGTEAGRFIHLYREVRAELGLV